MAGAVKDKLEAGIVALYIWLSLLQLALAHTVPFLPPLIHREQAPRQRERQEQANSKAGVGDADADGGECGEYGPAEAGGEAAGTAEEEVREGTEGQERGQEETQAVSGDGSSRAQEEKGAEERASEAEAEAEMQLEKKDNQLKRIRSGEAWSKQNRSKLSEPVRARVDQYEEDATKLDAEMEAWVDAKVKARVEEIETKYKAQLEATSKSADDFLGVLGRKGQHYNLAVIELGMELMSQRLSSEQAEQAMRSILGKMYVPPPPPPPCSSLMHHPAAALCSH
jgi:hypothetical protein